jgi:hypothetical protein
MLTLRGILRLRASFVAGSALGGMTLALACTQGGTIAAGGEGSSTSVSIARTLAAREPGLAHALDRNDAAWQVDGAGYTGRGLPAGTAPRVGAVLPGKATDTLAVGLGRAEAKLSITLEGAGPAAPRLDDGSVVYPGAYPSTDVIMALQGGRFEELLLLRDEAAPTEFAWHVALPEGIVAARIDAAGGVRFDDAGGEGVLRTPRPYAVDASGVRRDAALSWSSGRLAILLDTTGLTFPVLLDPAVESYAWVQMMPATSPGDRDSYAMAYDGTSSAGNVVLFGGIACTNPASGNSCTTALNDTWTWNGTNWTQATVSSPPPARYFANMVYDSAIGGDILFGGVPNTGIDVADTWEWTGSAWKQLSPTASPAARDQFAMAYDSGRSQVLIFGGEKCSNAQCTTTTALNDTWAFNGTTWTQFTTATAPSKRIGARMVYDSVRNVTVLFGGANCQLWGSETDCPGTSAGPVDYADTWEWNGSSWTQVMPAASPPARDSFAMAFDSIRGQTVLFGGYDVNLVNDTWEWNGTNWTQTSPATSPAFRYWIQGAFDTAVGRFVVYGGIPANSSAPDLNDTWEYSAHGESCATGAQCDTGFCVDGVCCSTSSCGTCQQCNTATSPGTCATITNAPDPDNCTGDYTCNSAGQCLLVAGQPCPTGNGACAGGSCVNGVCCSSACTSACDVCAKALGAPADGTCGPAAAGYSGNPLCSGGYLCNGTSPTCPASCSADADCATGYYCDANGQCAAQKPQGGTCSGTAGTDCLQGNCRECATGNCVDGICCNSSCSGACNVCSKALGASADGTCSTAPAGYAGSPTCAPYSCSGASGSCPTGCTSSSQCSTGSFCMNGGCQGTETAGQACGTGAACASGFCVDGVCCNSACTGQCEACDVADSTGTCTPVAGAPHGTRMACPAGSATDPCAAAVCDGNTRSSCAGFAGSSVTCRQATCTEGVATLPASCNGMGACPAPVTKNCSPYVCDGTSCKTQCAADSDCAAGERCDGATGVCVAGVTCDGNHTITGANGTQTDCSPYICTASGCMTSCSGLQDCVSPAVCNGSGQCVQPGGAGTSGNSGGNCALSAGGPGPAGPGLLALLSLLPLSAWRRSRRRSRRHPSPHIHR